MTPVFFVACGDCGQRYILPCSVELCRACNSSNLDVREVITDERKAQLIREWKRPRPQGVSA